MKTYKTSEIAKTIGIHPNTVRLYEQWGLVPEAERLKNGYRVFTDYHLEQFKLARAALKVEILQNGLRNKAIDIIKASAEFEMEKALNLTDEYLMRLEREIENAEEAIDIVKNILKGSPESEKVFFRRKEAADHLNISIDTLRNWELNGLLTVKRKSNGYRVYEFEDIQRLKIIRSLRCANYSLSAILRMLNALSQNPGIDIKKVIDTPREDENIIAVCDKLLTSLSDARKSALDMKDTLKRMKNMI